jgi:hypothetical protein
MTLWLPKSWWEIAARLLALNALLFWIMLQRHDEVTSRELLWTAVFIAGLNAGMWVLHWRNMIRAFVATSRRRSADS